MNRRMLRGLNPDLRETLLSLNAQGWEVTQTRGGHLKLSHTKTRAFVFSTKTPSCRRGVDNLTAQCRRALDQQASRETSCADTTRHRPGDEFPSPHVIGGSGSAWFDAETGGSRDARNRSRVPGGNHGEADLPSPGTSPDLHEPSIAAAPGPDADPTPLETSSPQVREDDLPIPGGSDPSTPHLAAGSGEPARLPSRQETIMPHTVTTDPRVDQGSSIRSDAPARQIRPSRPRALAGQAALPSSDRHRAAASPVHLQPIPQDILPEALYEIFLQGLETTKTPFLAITPDMVGSLLVKMGDGFRLVASDALASSMELSADERSGAFRTDEARSAIPPLDPAPAPATSTAIPTGQVDCGPIERREAILKVLRIARDTGGEEEWVSWADLIDMAFEEMRSASGSATAVLPLSRTAWWRSIHAMVGSGQILCDRTSIGERSSFRIPG